jgi:hypothetical protein
MNAPVSPPADAIAADVAAALDFDAPYLVEKLVKNRVVDSTAEAEALFREVKRYLVMARTDERRIIWEMHSLRVDEVWHQFILYTVQYAEFCQRHFGRYIHHAPSNAPHVEHARTIPVGTFDQFRDRYAALFGTALPDLWYDDRTVTVNRLVRNERAGRLTLRHDADMVELVTESGDAIFAVNDVAAPALGFVAATGAFHVRELPGGLDDEEKVALAATLIECRVLKAA